jgi:hypothetical protein
MVNKSKKDVAYTMVDAVGEIGDAAEKLAALDFVIRVRVIK